MCDGLMPSPAQEHRTRPSRCISRRRPPNPEYGASPDVPRRGLAAPLRGMEMTLMNLGELYDKPQASKSMVEEAASRACRCASRARTRSTIGASARLSAIWRDEIDGAQIPARGALPLEPAAGGEGEEKAAASRCASRGPRTASPRRRRAAAACATSSAQHDSPSQSSKTSLPSSRRVS